MKYILSRHVLLRVEEVCDSVLLLFFFLSCEQQSLHFLKNQFHLMLLTQIVIREFKGWLEKLSVKCNAHERSCNLRMGFEVRVSFFNEEIDLLFLFLTPSP
jgi:hypothetical protein